MTNKVDQIRHTLATHANIAAAHNHHVSCVMLYGSQNYGLDTPESDIDSKIIATPSIMDIALNNKTVSTSYDGFNGEKIDVKDIRMMVDNYKKQNINFLETLYTEHYIAFDDVYPTLREGRDIFANGDMVRQINSVVGMAKEKYHALKKEYPSTIDKVKKFGYDPKQLHHIIRLYAFLSDRLEYDYSFEDALKPYEKTFLLEVKNGVFPLDVAEAYADKFIAALDNIREKYLPLFPKEPSKEMIEFSNDVLYKTLLQSFKEEIISK